MRRSSTTSTLSGFALVAVLAACGDSATAPQPMLELAPAPALPSHLIRIDRMASDSSSADFTVDEAGGVFELGPHAIYFPPNSICDPATSTYGPGEWDAPCEPMRGEVAIHAEIRKIDGKEWVDFTPSLRFVPADSSNQWVWIWMHTDQASDPAFVASLNILWTPGFNAEGVDESLDDHTLATRSYPEHQIVYRRIKHFSGYQVATDYMSTQQLPQLDLPQMDEGIQW
jgi:hypothetical protein